MAWAQNTSLSLRRCIWNFVLTVHFLRRCYSLNCLRFRENRSITLLRYMKRARDYDFQSIQFQRFQIANHVEIYEFDVLLHNRFRVKFTLAIFYTHSR